jgi:hypothetical protein
MRLARMTTRRWMIAVAVVGLLLGVVVGGQRLKQRRDYYIRQANVEARWENFFRSMAASGASRRLKQRPFIILDGHSHQAATLSAYFAGRKDTCLHASSRPWLSGPPALPAGDFIIIDPLSQTVVFDKTGHALPNSGDSPSF